LTKIKKRVLLDCCRKTRSISWMTEKEENNKLKGIHTCKKIVLLNDIESIPIIEQTAKYFFSKKCLDQKI